MDYASRTKRVQIFRWDGRHAVRRRGVPTVEKYSWCVGSLFPFSRQGTGGWTTRTLPLSAERSNRAGAG
jgi:hypothetical protein